MSTIAEGKRKSAAKERALQLEQWQMGQRWAIADRKAKMEEERRKACKKIRLENGDKKSEPKELSAKENEKKQEKESLIKELKTTKQSTGTSNGKWLDTPLGSKYVTER